MRSNGDKNQSMNNSVFLDIRCHLHTSCNLRCKFCSETKEKGIRISNKINVDYIRQLPDEIISSIRPKLRDDRSNIVFIGLQGGELFYDALPDSLFNEYRKFCSTIKSKLKETGLPIEFKLIAVSNGIFKNYDRVEKFLKEFNVRLILSYDPVGRFANKEQQKQWFDTYKYFHSRDEFEVHVSTVLTKKNIDKYLSNDEFFEKIDNGTSIVIHEYFPRLDYQEYLANDDDLFDFYKWSIDNGKFNISHINNIIESYKNGNPATTCCDTIDYLFDDNYKSRYEHGYINQCAENPINKKEYYGTYADRVFDDNDCSVCKQSLGIEKRGCLLCEYYNQCPKMCWTQILFDKYELLGCPIKRIYQYLEENPNIVDRYNDWRVNNEHTW